MCISNRQLDPKTRCLMRIANIAFIFGILLSSFERWHWVHPSSQVELNWLDAFTGFFFGLYIAIIFFGLRGARRCGSIAPEEQ
jgi:hypothetical protein